MRTIRLALLAVACASAASAATDSPVPGRFFRLRSAVTLPGKSPDWDYLAYDAARGRLFIARRKDGLWVFDTRSQRLVTRIAMTRDAGATLLVPSLNRGFTTNEDGSTTVFNLATLAPIRRMKFADDADSASFEPSTGRIAFVSSDSHLVTFVDARGLNVVGHAALQAQKLDGSEADGAGAILLNERDRNTVVRIDARTFKVTAEWALPGCSQPTGMAVDIPDHRAFIGCRGDKPVLAVLDTETGKEVATLALGHGNDGVVYDAARRRIITTNGIEGNIVVYRQDSADSYRIEQAITTRPMARTIAYDPARQRIFTVTAQGVVNPREPVNTGPSAFYPNAYYDGTFEVLTYAPNVGAGAEGKVS